MTIPSIILWVLLLAMVALIGMMFSKKRWYIVNTAEPEKLLLSRSMMEWEVSGTLVFRDEEKRKVIIPKRWILKITEVKKEELPDIQDEFKKSVNA